MARLAQTHVLHVTQEACAARWAEAGEGAHTVDAGGSWGTGGSDTVIQVLLTACPSPATHTHAVEATSRVLAGSPISAARGTLGLTFIHIFRAIPACPGLWAEAGVGVQLILASGPILTLVADTVVWIHLTVQACETWGAEAQVEGGVPPWNQLAGAPIKTAPGGARPWLEPTGWALPPRGAETPEGPQGVVAGGALGAGSRVQETLVHIVFTGMSLEARWAAALDLGVCGQTCPSIGAGVGRAEVPKLALLTYPARHAEALWTARGLDVAAAHFGTEGRTGVLELGLAPLTSEARGAGAEEAEDHERGATGGACEGRQQSLTAASILAELGILAGVRKLACLTQEARGALAGPLPLR